MYTLEDFKEEVTKTKAKMEELAAYLKTIDAAVKKQLESWDLDGCVEQLQEYMIPEMEKLLQQVETGAFFHVVSPILGLVLSARPYTISAAV